MSTPPRDTSGEKPLRIRRGRVDSVDLYEIKDSELDLLEKGPPADLYLNFAIFLISIAFSGLVALFTSTFKYDIVETAFVVVTVVGFLLGALLLVLWHRGRQQVATVIKAIRDRIPPEASSAPSIEARPAGDAEISPPAEPRG